MITDNTKSVPDRGTKRISVVVAAICFPKKFVIKMGKPVAGREKIRNRYDFSFSKLVCKSYLERTLMNSSTGCSAPNSPRFFLIFAKTAIYA